MLVVDVSGELLVLGVLEAGVLEAGALEAGALEAGALLAAGVPHDASIITAANDVRIVIEFFFIKTFSSYFRFVFKPNISNVNSSL